MPVKNNEHIRAVVFVNENARQGRGKKLWEQIAHEVLARLPENTLVETLPVDIDFQNRVSVLVNNGVDYFIAAGGDGTVNVLLNAIFAQKTAEPASITMGAIGLGSSNDFHKPLRDTIAGVPIRIDYRSAAPADVGMVRFGTNGRLDKRKYFIINASIGVTAEANALFNRGDALLNRLKAISTNAAIWYAALKTLLLFRNIPVALEFGHELKRMYLSNLAAVKIPFVSGEFLYPRIVDIDDGRLGLFYCENFSRLELVQTLKALRKGHFEGPGLALKAFNVIAEHLISLETDGEIASGTRFEFSVLPRAIKLPTNEWK